MWVVVFCLMSLRDEAMFQTKTRESITSITGMVLWWSLETLTKRQVNKLKIGTPL